MKQTLHTIRTALDEQRPALLPLRQLAKPPRGWIATVRSALGMTQKVLAERLRVSKQRVSQLEAREIAGEATLAQMRDAADALGCDFVYALVPRNPLKDTVSERARAIALRELGAVERSMQLEDQRTVIDEERIRDYIARHVTERDLWRHE
jgi:predicted DNA-binding mobile mystery protein A